MKEQIKTFDEYQQLAERTATRKEGDTQEKRLSMCRLGLAGEAGEVAELVKKHLLTYLAVLANSVGIAFSDVAEVLQCWNGFSNWASKNRIDVSLETTSQSKGSPMNPKYVRLLVPIAYPDNTTSYGILQLPRMLVAASLVNDSPEREGGWKTETIDGCYADGGGVEIRFRRTAAPPKKVAGK